MEQTVYQRSFPAHVKHLSEVISFLEESLQGLGTAPSVLMPLALSVEEAFVNIALYAYPGTKEGVVEVSLRGDQGYAAVTLTDNGIEFDPLDRPMPDISADIEDRTVGGLGIYMIRKLSDEVIYSRHEGKNRLMITIRSRKGE